VTISSFVPGGTLEVPGFVVQTAAVPHGSMWTTAFRITADGKTVTFLSDVEYPSVDEPLPQALALAQDADLLIHDAMHSDLDYEMRRCWGHSPAHAGVVVAERAKAKRLALFHHCPTHSDDDLDRMLDAAEDRRFKPLGLRGSGDVAAPMLPYVVSLTIQPVPGRQGDPRVLEPLTAVA